MQSLLGVGAADYGGTLASILAWALLLLFAIASIATVSAVRRFDRAVTGRIAYGVAELRRRVRMAITFARYRRTKRTVRAEPTFDGEEPTLSAATSWCSSCTPSSPPGFALAVSDIADELDTRSYEIRTLLERLQKLELLQATVGGLDGETAYTLTAAAAHCCECGMRGRGRRSVYACFSASSSSSFW